MGKHLRRVLISLAILVALLAAGILGGFAWLRGDSGRAWLVTTLERETKAASGFELSIEAFEGDLTEALVLKSIALSDTEGRWLTATEMRLRWRPRELLEGKLHLVSLVIDELKIDRPPREKPGDEDEDEDGEAALPFELQLDRIAIMPLTLGPEFLGETADFEIQGSLASRAGDELRSRLSVVQLGEIGASLDAEATYRLSDGHLRADLDLAEPTGRLMRRLTGLAQAGATKMTLGGEGDLSVWRGRTDFSSEGLGTLQSELTLGLIGDPTLQASGSLRVDWQPPDVPPALLEGQSRFTLQAGLADGDRLSISMVELENDGVAISGQGELQLSTNQVTATAEIEVKDQEILDGLTNPVSVRGLVLKASLSGPLERPEIKADAEATTALAPGLESGPVTLSFSAVPETASWQLAGEGRLEDPILTDLAAAQSLIGPALEWRFQGQFDQQSEHILIDRANVSAAGFDLAAEGSLTPGLDLSTKLELGDLGLLAPLTGFEVAGGLSLDAVLRSADLSRGIEAELDGIVSRLSVGNPQLDEILGPDLAIGARVATADFALFSLSDVRLDTALGELSAALDLELENKVIDGDIELEIGDLRRLSPILGQDIAGSAQVASKLAGQLDDPNVEGRIALAGLAVDPLVPADVTIDFTSKTVVSRPHGRIDVGLDAGPLKLSAETGYALADQDLQLDGLAVRTRGLSAQGDVTVPLRGQPISGRLGVTVEDLAPTLALLSLSGRGQGKAELILAGDADRQTGRMVAGFTGLQMALSEDGALDIGTADLTARSSDLKRLAFSELGLTLQEVTIGAVDLDRFALTGQGTAEALDFAASAEGDLLGPFELESAGSLTLEESLTSLRLDRLEGKLLEQDLALNQAARLSYGDGTLDARSVSLTFGTARLDLEASVSPAQSEIELSLAQLPLALARIALPDSEIAGTASLDAKLAGPGDRLSGSFTLVAEDVILGKDLESPPLTIAVEGRLTGDRLESKGTLSGFSTSDARFDLALPLRLAFSPASVVMAQDPPLAGSADWQGELSQVWALVPLDGHRAAGRADVEITLSGSLADPKADGKVTLEGGEYENFAAGTLLRDLSLLVEIAGERVVIRELKGTDGGSGTLSGSGALDLAPEKDFPFDLDAVFSNFTLVRRDDVTAASNGTVKLAGRTTDATIEGALETTEVEIRVPDRLPPEIADLEVIEEGSGAVAAPEEARKDRVKAESKIALDLTIEMPARVFVRGRGLDTEWSGRFRIGGTTAAPSVEGELENIRGRLRAVGKEFTLENSKITFAGTDDLTPLLDIRALYEADDIVVTALVTGTPDQPTITLTSVPTLPRDEIIARVLFGKSTAQLSAVEALQLASSAAELSGSGFGAAGVLDFTRDLIGVDVLNVDTSDAEAGGAEVRAGKYVSDGVFVGVKQGTTPQSSSVEVEVELTPNISLQSDVGQSGEGNLGVKFKWDY